ncbi:MAG: LacI family DNA-binding transcriptional regulator, partial [Burkholderiales bacterium]|nr:LacI family DNA-binding transcriptional regulator [Opitutaceae bacterium]
RARVAQAARALGYRADPELGRIMSAVRRAGRFQPHDVVALLHHPHRFNRYHRCILAEARRVGPELGLLVHDIDVSGFTSARGLTRRLQALGAHGIAVLPLSQEHPLPTIDWAKFSAISFYRKQRDPLLHRVLPDHGKSGYLAFERLVGQGARRIGFVTSRLMDAQLGGHPRHGFLRAQDILGNGGSVPPLVLTAGAELAEARAWRRRHRPDAVIVSDDEFIAPVRATGGDLRLLSIGGDPLVDDVDRVFQHPEMVARQGLKLLAGLLAQGERGVPALASTMLIAGEWFAAGEVDGGEGTSPPMTII